MIYDVGKRKNQQTRRNLALMAGRVYSCGHSFYNLANKTCQNARAYASGCVVCGDGDQQCVIIPYENTVSNGRRLCLLASQALWLTVSPAMWQAFFFVWRGGGETILCVCDVERHCIMPVF